MEETYEYLLSLEFRHEYFKDGIFRSLQVSFDEDTLHIMRNMGLVIKSFPGGIHIFTSNRQLLEDNTLDMPLRLFLDCNDSYFINYSDLMGFRPADTILYFNNLDVLYDSQKIQLHSDTYVGQKEVASLSFGKLIISKSEPNNDYDFQDVFGNDISGYINPLPDNNQEYKEYLVTDLPQGLIRVFSEGIQKKLFYYYPKTVWKKPLGVLELYVPQLYEQLKVNQNEKLKYVLNFRTKSTIWKYFLLDPAYKNFVDLSIIDNNKEQLFKSPEKVSVQEAEALVFESKNLIALKEFPTEYFQLVESFDVIRKTANSVVFKSLPMASPEQLYMDNSTLNGYFYSHIYL